MDGTITDEMIAEVLQDEDPGELACALYKCVYPALADKPQYNDAGLWQAVDSKNYQRWADGALKFIDHMRKRDIR